MSEAITLTSKFRSHPQDPDLSIEEISSGECFVCHLTFPGGGNRSRCIGTIHPSSDPLHPFVWHYTNPNNGREERGLLDTVDDCALRIYHTLRRDRSADVRAQDKQLQAAAEAIRVGDEEDYQDYDNG